MVLWDIPKREVKRVPAAEYNEPVHWHGHDGYASSFVGEGWFRSVDDLITYCAHKEIDPPAEVFGSYSYTLRLDADEIISNTLEAYEFHEDARSCVTGEEELQDFLDTWNEKHGKSVRAYQVDQGTVVVLRER